PALEQSLLAKLAGDSDEFVRMAVAANPASAAPVLSQLGKDSSAWVLLVLAGNAQTPEETLVALAQQSDRTLRGKLIARGPNLPEKAYAVLVTDPDVTVRESIAGATRAKEILSGLAKDPETRVRARVAANATAPAETVALLAKDPSAAVRAAAGANKSA